MIDRALKPALDVVEEHWRDQWRPAQSVKGKEGGKGALIFVGKRGQDKFFSNGTFLISRERNRTDLTLGQVLTIRVLCQTRISSVVSVHLL